MKLLKLLVIQVCFFVVVFGYTSSIYGYGFSANISGNNFNWTGSPTYSEYEDQAAGYDPAFYGGTGLFAAQYVVDNAGVLWQNGTYWAGVERWRDFTVNEGGATFLLQGELDGILSSVYGASASFVSYARVHGEQKTVEIINGEEFTFSLPYDQYWYSNGYTSYSAGQPGIITDTVSDSFSNNYLLPEGNYTFETYLEARVSGSPGQSAMSNFAPEPISSILFITGGTLLAGRRFMRRKA